MIDDSTVCINCGTAAKMHCGVHALRCCPRRCPGDTELDERFCAPQPPRPEVVDRDKR